MTNFAFSEIPKLSRNAKHFEKGFVSFFKKKKVFYLLFL